MIKSKIFHDKLLLTGYVTLYYRWQFHKILISDIQVICQQIITELFATFARI